MPVVLSVLSLLAEVADKLVRALAWLCNEHATDVALVSLIARGQLLLFISQWCDKLVHRRFRNLLKKQLLLALLCLLSGKLCILSQAIT